VHREIAVAAIGGQGALTAGNLLALTAMAKGLHVAAVPNYLPEVRGAEANCFVIVSDEPIANCLVTEPHVALLLCAVSAQKYASRVREKGLIIYNSTLVPNGVTHPSAQIVAVPATETAQELGAIQAANMVMLGAYATLDDWVTLEELITTLQDTVKGRARKYLEVNISALRAGADLARNLR